MGGIESLGTLFIVRLQSLGGPGAELFFRLVTTLGDEKFFLLLLPLVYWCVDKRLGIRLAALVLASGAINLWCKFAFGLPRPPSPPVRQMVSETGPGFPSGHTQAVTVAFGYLASQLQRWRIHVLAAVAVLLVGLSRLYLGVHFPHDVLGGLVIGYLVLFLYVKATPLVAPAWRSWSRAWRYGLAIGVPVLLLAAWPTEDIAGDLGALAGFAVGALLEGDWVGSDTAGTFAQRLLRFLLGTVVVAGLYFGLKGALPAGVPWRFLRYGSIGLFASAAAPWLFVRLGLARAEAAAVQASQSL